MPNNNATLQDISIIRGHILKLRSDLNLIDNVSSFYFFALDSILKLQNNEIDDSITDNNYLKISGRQSGHDRGIDALYIDDNTSPATIHLFNCKYSEKFEKLENNFPSSEIDKILSFMNCLMRQDSSIKKDMNPVLYAKVEEIWNIFNNSSPKFNIHLCSTLYNQIEKNENDRFHRELNRFSFTKLSYHLMPEFIKILTHRDKKIVNSKIRTSKDSLFEKTDGDIRALVVSIDAKNLLRILIDDDEIRKNVDLEDYSIIKRKDILEDAFEDNVRLYLKQRSKINRNIKETAISENGNRFFYYNNGITITCSSFSYNKIQFPVIEINNLQVVNGSQTIHALYEAFCQDDKNFEDIEILCRIYETINEELSINIAEYTNSQNPVKSRDIRSNDYIQKKLEIDLETFGYFYERKKNQYLGKSPKKRIDSEKAGQVLMAFYNELPGEAKDKKPIIFAEKYEEIFNDTITAEKVIAPILLLDEIEKRKKKIRDSISIDPVKFESDSFILHATFYIIYTIKKLAELENKDLNKPVYKELISYYSKAKRIIKKSIAQELKTMKSTVDTYNHRVFFKGNRPKMHIESEIIKMRKST